jgi:hypothetical protein
MSQSLKWNGDALTAKMRRACIEGVDEVMADCVVHAKNNHPWKNQSGTLEGDIQVAEYARTIEGGVEGMWGVRKNNYALIHELGGTIVPVKARALAIPQPDGSVRLVKSVTIPPRPYLRPAADANYPQLPAKIRAAFERQAGQRG